MENEIGKRLWAIPEGYIPEASVSDEREFVSHETVCILNASENDTAHIEITIYFSDREPAGPYCFEVPARRTKHLRFNDFWNPEVIPRGMDYSSVIRSDVPVVVQHTRMDTRRAEIALLSTMAYSAD